MPYLAIIAGLPARAFPLRPGSFTVGRSSESELELAHVEISRQHCRFTWDGKRCAVEDLGSARGTAVNGERIFSITRLNPGDKISIGPAVLEFGLGDPPQADIAETADTAATVLVKGVPAARIPIGGELIIGRDPQADVVLRDPAISRRHAALRALPHGGCLVADLHGPAGSFVNGRRFDEHELTVGDRLQIGPFCFQFDGQALARVTNAAGGCLQATNVFLLSGEQVILNDITLEVPPSHFVGIIGPSGAGKSSLLHALSGLRTPDRGMVIAEGTDVYSRETTHSFGFVPQEDIVHPELTVSEALRFGARLRLARETPPLEIAKLVLQTMDRLGLRERAGHSISRLSGGQRKRVSVGVELLAKPAILFLDEPTSGLDPATEFQLMELLRDLADTGCTIVCTTHVMENAYLMDELVVLVGGCMAFQGSPQEARDYFGVSKLTALYDRLAKRAPGEWQQEFAQEHSAASPQQAVSSSPLATSEHTRRSSLRILLQRQLAILSADWRNFIILGGQPVVIGALVSWVTDERALVMFFAYLATLWFGCSNAAQEIVKEIAIYRRERLVGVGRHSYLVSKFVFLTAITVAQALLLYLTLLVGEGGRDGSVSWQLAALSGTALAAVGLGLAISALSRTVMQAVMIVPLLLIPQIVFSGYTVPASDMSRAVRRVSQFMPSFCAQAVMDTSFLWRRPLTGDTISDHAQSYRNLDPERQLTSRDIYARKQPAVLGLIGQTCWGLVTYALAWFGLRRKERQ